MSSLFMFLLGAFIGFLAGWLVIGLCMASKHSQEQEDEDATIE